MNERDLDAEFEAIIAGWDAVAPDPTFDTQTAAERTPGPAIDPVIDPATDPVGDPGGDRCLDPGGEAATGPPAQPAAEPATENATESASQPGDAAATPEASGPPDRPGPTGAGGVLGFPIAPGAGHVWRGAARPHDDDDAVLESLPSPDPHDDHFVPPTEMDLPTAEDDPMFWAIVVGLAGGPLLLLYLLFFDRDGSGWWIVTALTMIGVGFILLVLRGGTERDPSDDGTRI